MSGAPGKIILFGEHSVVYGKPAIAIPVREMKTTVSVGMAGESGIESSLPMTPEERGKAALLVEKILISLHRKETLKITICSDIPVSSGFGSSAALCVAAVRAISQSLDIRLSAEKVSDIAWECEKIFHGNSSGLDTSVIAYDSPVYFIMGKPELFRIKPCCILVADSGSRQPTKEIVESVRKRYDASPERYQEIFDNMGEIAASAKCALEKGEDALTGRLMTRNHELLKELGVSCPRLDSLVDSAVRSGAYGAKLSGAGLGGNVIALVEKGKTRDVTGSLYSAGAKRVFLTGGEKWILAHS